MALHGVALFAVAVSFAFVSQAIAREPVRIERLDNGLQVLLAPDSMAQAVDVGLWFDAGVRSEPEGRSGLTHVLSRMQFQGSAETAALTARIEAAGGLPGSSIFADLAGTSATVPPQQLDQALELQAGRLAAISVTEPILRTQVGFAREERARRIESNPVGRGVERLYACAFSGHPYARPVVGRDADLGKLTVAEAQAYARRRFTPAHGLLTIVGRFDPVQVRASVQRQFGRVPAAGSARAAEAESPPFRPIARATITAESRARLLLAGWRFPGRGDPAAAAAAVVARLLFGSGGVIERQLLASGGIFAQAQGDLDVRRDASLLYITAAVADEADSVIAENRLLSVVESLGREPIAEADFERARRQAEAAMLFPVQGAHGRALALASAQIVGGSWGIWEKEVEAIRRVTVEDVRRAAARSLVSPSRSIVWVQPAAAPETP